MSWKRDIPFGYKMEKSKIVPDETESDTVKQIFAMYISGSSLMQIARYLEFSGIRYHSNTAIWNKNSVSRILDNPRYTGSNGYPKIIELKDYTSVKARKAERAQKIVQSPESIQISSTISVCANCGTRMYRVTRKNARPRWVCQNEQCKETLIITDDGYREAIDRALDYLALSPALLDPCAPDKEQVTPDVLRLKNELTAAFNRGSESPEYMRSLIFALAAEQYNALPDMSLIHTLKELQDRIAAEGITEDNRREIEQKAVRRILLSRESGVSIELINGKIISSKEEAEQ